MALKHLIWIIPTSLTICWIATMMRDYDIEEIRQKSFMMQACISAGGQWTNKNTWSSSHNCLRPPNS